MTEKINLAAKLALLDQPYQPGIVGHINDYKLQVVKIKGPFVWHKHDETDDFFLVLADHPQTIHVSVATHDGAASPATETRLDPT